MILRVGFSSRHQNVVLGCLLEKLWQAWYESKLLGYLREIFLAGGVLKTTPLELLLMRCLLRRWHIRRQLTLIVEIIISVTWTIVVIRRRLVVVVVHIVAIVSLTVPSFSTATGTFIRRGARWTLSLWVRLLVALILKLLLLLIKLFLVSFVHVLLLVLRLVARTWLVVVVLGPLIPSFVVTVILRLLLFLIVLILLWQAHWILVVSIVTLLFNAYTWTRCCSSHIILGCKSGSL